VRDSGIGISPEMLTQVFDFFFQVDHATTKSQGGLGIGLTLVKKLIELHDGTVEAHSDGLGEGCEFIVRLPLVADQRQSSQREETAVPRVPPAQPSALRLLVVDDNHDAAISIAMLLRFQGYEVQVVHSGRDALSVLDTFMPDAVFLDIGMPGMDGLEVARRIRQEAHLRNIVLIALTGWGQEEDRRRTAEAGFDHHLVKPPKLDDVEKVLAPLKLR
jgi:CheY-like chemotaxis protein